MSTITVNDTEIPKYDEDTNNSIISRIAATFSTIPKYIYFTDTNGEVPENLKDEQDVKFIDLLSLIKKDAKKNIDFSQFIRDNSKYFKDLDIVKDVLPIWLVYAKQLTNLSAADPELLNNIAEVLVARRYFRTMDMFKSFWTQRKSVVKNNLENFIEQEKIKNDKFTKIYEYLASLDPENDTVTTEFEPEKIFINTTLNSSDMSILEIFNRVILSDIAPFCRCKTTDDIYYKILKGFVPHEDWAHDPTARRGTRYLEEADNVSLKICEKMVVEKQIDFTDAIISRKGDDMIMRTKINTAKKYLSQTDFLERFLGCFVEEENKIRIVKVEQTEIAGLFFIPQFRVDSYVFADLVMNDPTFSELMYIDESDKATKRKGETGQPWLYIHFEHPSTGHLTASIAQRIVNRSDPEVRELNLDIFPHNSPYVRIRVKAENEEAIRAFQRIFSKLMGVYLYEKYSEILDIYREYLPTFGENIEIQRPLKKKEVQLLAPELFVQNYSRVCAQNRMPKIVNDQEAEDAISLGREIMRFPREKAPTDDEGNVIGPVYPSDNENIRNFICPEDFPYPGLIQNKLSNSNLFPYIPCCFKQPQKNSAAYTEYFGGRRTASREKKQQDFIITDKFVTLDKFGFLPENLQKFFNILDPEYKYIRVGVSRNYNSFLHCIMSALRESTDFTTKRESSQIEAVVEKRKELARSNLIGLSRQCTYDISKDKLKERLNANDTYFDPRNFVQALESYFGCNIFLFNRTQLFLPKFAQSYYRFKRQDNCVFIYEHWGSESDHAKYPQCEIIARWKEGTVKDIKLAFEYKSAVAMQINRIFRILNMSYTLNKFVEETSFPIDGSFINQQKLDSYGKCRIVFVDVEGISIPIITSPIPPLPVKMSETKKIWPVEIEDAMKLMGKLGIEIVGVQANKISGKIGNTDVAIYISPHKTKLYGNDNGVSFMETNEESSLEIFNRNKKLARYITEYLFWFFSKYIEENKLPINDKNIAKFAKNRIEINPEYIYPRHIPKNFSEGIEVINNGKLVVTSEDMLKRLLYLLKLYCTRDMETLLEYHKRTSITRYYEDISDFETRDDQTIIKGEDAIEKWIEESKITYNLYDEIARQSSTPYFIKNANFNDDEKQEDADIYLAQNATSLQHAICISVLWGKKKYNVAKRIPKEIIQKTRVEKYTYILYEYTDNKNITRSVIAGEKTDYMPRIVKQGDEYTALLNLDA